MAERKKRGATRNTVCEYAARTYGTEAECPWASLPLYSVLRRADNKKWYAVIMNLPKSKLGLGGGERIDVIDLKCSPADMAILLGEEGFLPAYHLNRRNWITALLDGTVDSDLLMRLLDGSYSIAGGTAKKLRTEPTSWLVPANPKYFDVVKAFSESKVIIWKQSNSVIVGDTIYLYLTAPYSCVMFRCRALETDIPYEYSDANVSMKKVMKIELLHTYPEGAFGADRLHEHGVVSVRGPRSIPYGLLYDLEKEKP